MTADSPERPPEWTGSRSCPGCGAPFRIDTDAQRRAYIRHLEDHLTEPDDDLSTFG